MLLCPSAKVFFSLRSHSVCWLPASQGRRRRGDGAPGAAAAISVSDTLITARPLRRRSLLSGPDRGSGTFLGSVSRKRLCPAHRSLGGPGQHT